MVRPIAITSGRHPFELAFLIAATAIGVLLLVTGHRPRSAEAMPHLIQVAWPAVLVAGGLITLAGVLWPRLDTGLRVELVGVIVLGGALVVYTIALIKYSGMSGATAAGFTLAFGAGSWWRAVQIHRDLARLACARDAGRLATVPILVEEP